MKEQKQKTKKGMNEKENKRENKKREIGRIDKIFSNTICLYFEDEAEKQNKIEKDEKKMENLKKIEEIKIFRIDGEKVKNRKNKEKVLIKGFKNGRKVREEGIVFSMEFQNEDNEWVYASIKMMTGFDYTTKFTDYPTKFTTNYKFPISSMIEFSPPIAIFSLGFAAGVMTKKNIYFLKDEKDFAIALLLAYIFPPFKKYIITTEENKKKYPFIKRIQK